MQAFDRTGAAQKLGNEIARGGEGSIFPVAGRHSVVAKLYHPEVIARRGGELEDKVAAMTSLRGHFDASALAWPAIPVFGADGNWCGYAMRRAEGIPLSKVAHPILGPRHIANLDRIHIARMLLSIVRTLGRLHGAGVCLGDINPNNFLYEHATGSVTLIDCDSYQITAGGRTHRCVVNAPDMMAPEHHGADLKVVNRTPESDLFSLAILVFKCLMLGRHPYDSVGGGDVQENLRGGHFPYGTGGAAPGFHGAIPSGPWYLIWSHLSFDLKTLLIRTFTDGAADPAVRPRPSEWIIALEKYLHGLERGHHELALRPSAVKCTNLRGAAANNSSAPRAAA